MELVSLQESDQRGDDYFSLVAAKANKMAIDEENSMKPTADYNNAFNIFKQVEAPQLTITTSNLTRPVPI